MVRKGPRDLHGLNYLFNRVEDSYREGSFLEAFGFLVKTLPHGLRSPRMKQNVALPDNVEMYLQARVYDIERGYLPTGSELGELRKFLRDYLEYTIHTGKGIDAEIILNLERILEIFDEEVA